MRLYHYNMFIEIFSPLEHYMSQDQQNVVVPRPEGMSFWEQSEVGSSVLSARSRLSRLGNPNKTNPNSFLFIYGFPPF